MQSSTACRCIGLLWEFQAPSDGLLRCKRSNLNLEVLVYVGATFLFLYLFLALPLYLLISLFTYFSLSLFFISSLFLCVILLLFFYVFGAWAWALSMLRGLTNYIDILFFTWSVMGNQNNIVKFRGFLAVPVFRGALGCSRVFQSVSVSLCSCVPVFLLLVHVILL